MHGLGQNFELVALGSGLLEQIGRGRLPRKKKDLASGQVLTDADGGLDTVHVLHDDIADHQVWAARAGAGHSLCSGVNRAGLKSILVEDGSQGVRYHPLVIDHQDAWLGGLAIVAGHNRYSRNLQTISKNYTPTARGNGRQ